MNAHSDTSGAIASNAGDEFHEIWALREALRLLDPAQELTAITLEGVSTNGKTEGRQWDGVDCAAYFGGSSIDDCERVDLVQLKYSVASPNKNWTLGRLTSNSAQNGNNSVARRLGDAYATAVKGRGKQFANESVSVSLVSNQPIASNLKELVRKIRGGHLSSLDAQKLRAATGLSRSRFKDFCHSLSLKGGRAARATIKAKLVRTIAGVVDTEVAGTLADLRQTVRARMLPESSDAPITKETVLTWFNVGDPRSLFPCPPEFEKTRKPISRKVIRDLAGIVESSQHVCLEGRGGCGKTTAILSLESQLPVGSQVFAFDCYGGGSYLDLSLSRHRPTDAFVQISNEIGVRMGIPYLFPHRDNPNVAASFRHRIGLASKILRAKSNNALLVVVVDSADNAVFAADQVTPRDRCFVDDFVSMERLPENVRLVVTTRTSRIGGLHLPGYFAHSACGPFDTDETARFVRGVWKDASIEDIEQFHLLSNAIPRVQASVIARAATLEEAIEGLRPSGQTLDGLFDSILEQSAKKLTGPTSLDRFCCAISVLQTPAPIEFVAELSHDSSEFVQEVCDDLSPNLRLSSRGLEFANEDFEAYVRKRIESLEEEVRGEAADVLYRERLRSRYAAVHLSDALCAAGRSSKLFALLSEDSSTRAISDQVIRRRTELRRLKAAIAFANSSGDPVEAGKVMLIGAEAAQSGGKVEELLSNNIDLSACFAEQTIRQEVLRNPDQRHLHGPLLMHLAVVTARAQDTLPLSREYGRLALEWVRERAHLADHEIHSWALDDRDIAALVYAIYRGSGWEKAERFCESWRPDLMPIAMITGVVEQILLREGRETLERVRSKMSIDYRWLATIYLQRAGVNVPKTHLRRELDHLLDYAFPSLFSGADYFPEQDRGISVVYNLLFFAELCCSRRLPKTKVRQLIDLAWPKEMRSWRRTSTNTARNMDLTLRAESVLAVLKREPLDAKSVFRIEEKDRPQDADLPKSVKALLTVAESCKKFWSISAITLDSEDAASVAKELRRAVAEITKDAWRRRQSYEFSFLEDFVSRRIVDVHGIHQLSASDTIDLLERLFGEYDLFGQRLSPSLRVLLCDPTTLDELVPTVERYVALAAQSGGPASEQSEVLVNASRLLLESSPADSQAYFQLAVSTIEGLDIEAIDQLHFLLAASRRFPHDTPRSRRACAHLSAVVEHIVRTLGQQEGVPKNEALAALAALSTPTALCAAGRWTDVGLFATEDALSAVVKVALREGTIDAATGTALMLLLDEEGLSLESTVLESAKSLSANTQKKVVNELASRALRLRGHDAIIGTCEKIQRSGLGIDEAAGDIRRLLALAEFLKTCASELKQPEEDSASPSTSGGRRKATQGGLRAVDCTSSRSIAFALDERRNAGAYADNEFFEEMRLRVRSAERSKHLDALSELAQSADWPHRYVDAILGCLAAWTNAAVRAWSVANAPDLIIGLGASLLGYGWYDRDKLSILLDVANLEQTHRVSLIIKTVEQHSEHAGSLSLFKFATQLILELSESEAEELFEWYLKRRLDALQASDPPSPVVGIECADVPESVGQCIAYLLYRFLGDVDVRVRWKAAHCLRSLIRCDQARIISDVLACRSTEFDFCFAAPQVPFHFLTAKLWLAMSLARIAQDEPQVIADHSQEILAIAVDRPAHLLIELHIKRALLAASLSTDLSDIDEDAYQRLAQPQAGETVLQEGHLRSSFGHQTSQDDVRFHFDAMDTLPYWYSTAQQTFADVSPDEFLKAADRWISDEWEVKEDAYRWDSEPRKARFDERRFGLWSAGHGSYPTLERFSTYLQWHAMFVVVAEFLRTRQICAIDGEENSELDDFIRRWDITDEAYWLSDIRGSKPPSLKYWSPHPVKGDNWLDRPKNSQFFSELTDTMGRIVLSSERDIVKYRYGSRATAERISVSSAFVPAKTAGALLRALQMTKSPHDYYFPHEPESDFGMSEHPPEFALVPSIRCPFAHKDLGFDDSDPLRFGTTGVREAPASALLDGLNLVQLGGEPTRWLAGLEGPTIAEYATWSDLYEAKTDYEARQHNGQYCMGNVLSIDKRSLLSLIANLDMAVIFGVQIDRSIGDSYGRNQREEARKETFAQIYLLKDGGSFEDFSGTCRART